MCHTQNFIIVKIMYDMSVLIKFISGTIIQCYNMIFRLKQDIKKYLIAGFLPLC